MKIILVDDEKGIVEGLKKMIGRSVPECRVVGSAHNGLDGFELIQRLNPDIVVTDIRMPKADGLDMITMLKSADIHAKYILLSGYADFEYAKKGIQLGVEFYLNKPVDEQELSECLKQVMESIRADRTKLKEVNELKKEVHKGIQEKALRDIIDLGSEQSDLVEELLQIAGIPVEYKRFAAVIIEAGSIDYLKEFGFQPIFKHIDLALRQYKQVYKFRYSGTQIAVVIAHTSTIENGGIIRAVQHFRETVNRQLRLSVTVGIGTAKDRATGISQSFEEARSALSYKLLKGADAIISFPEIMNLAGTCDPVHGEIIDRLDAALDNMDEEECAAIIREIFRGIERNPRLSPSELQMQCLYILLSSIRKMSIQQLQQNKLLSRQLLSLEGISSFRTLEALEEWMNQVIRGIIAFKKKHNIPHKKDMISEIKEYVSKHYNEQISLADLAARFFINPYYLSQIFKQKTGDTYLNFLTQIRIGKAKELLETTDLKMYEICQMVGYSDPQHFSRMFEKIAGCKPKEYRKNLPDM
ncbi:response regulator [Paenibacillus sp. BAC0078]